MDSNAVDQYFLNNKPDYVFMVAAKVSGIAANMANQLEILEENLQIEM